VRFELSDPGVTFVRVQRRTVMRKESSQPRDRALWIVALLGLIVLAFAAVSRGEVYSSTARRTDRFTAGKLRSLSAENISGEIQITEGGSFSAVAEVTVRAASAADAKRYLDQTKVEFEKDDGGGATLVTREPGTRVERRGRSWSVHVDRDECRYRIETRYRITLPADTALVVHTVNGNVTVQGITAPMEVNSVNGRVRVAGTRHDVRLHTVNGGIEATAAELPRGARIDTETVNGNVELRLPARAAFHVSGQTMNGDIVSTFPLPTKPAAGEAEAFRAEREKMRSERDRLRSEIRTKEREQKGKQRQRDENDDSEDIHIDLSGLNESLQELSLELSTIGPEIAASISENLHRSYEGTLAGGGAEVRCSTLNGRIAILSDGSSLGEAKSLLPRKSHGSWNVTIPPIPPVPPVPSIAPLAPRAPGAPRAPRAPRSSEAEEGSIIRGDINGDFAITLPFGDVQLGRVSGSVRVVTYGGEITVADAGKSADLSTSGGDIRIENVAGNLRCVTHGGELVIGNVTGDAKLETMGGDVTLRSCAGSVFARAGGGDLALSRVRGSVQASSGGGSVRCQVVGRETPGGISISSGAGDVTLTLPANYRGNVDIRVNGVDSEGDYIVSEFPEVTVSKRSFGSTQSAEGALNGGGPKVSIRISSGTVRLKKGPPA
jgi:DUF4097 and DUF4098 domain-containing protein YvlB